MAVNDMLINLKRKPAAPAIKPDTSKLTEKRVTKGLIGAQEARRPSQASTSGPNLPVQELNKSLPQYGSLLETFRDRDKSTLLKEAKTRHGLSRNIVETRKNQMQARRLDWVKTGYELYNKYSFALVCFIFLFIGAPMGAIIRKGGFGYPILVSIIFFVTFIFLAILCKKLAETYIMTPFWAAMTPCAILAVFGIYVTRKAMNDSQLFSMESFERFFIRLQRKRKLKTQEIPS